MKISEIQKIIKDFEQSSLTELELELQEVKLKLSKNINEKNKNQNLLFSFLLKDIPINDLFSIKELIIDVLLSLLNKYEIKASFVEPNDIYIDDLKILGILIETKVQDDLLKYIVIGIGINVNQITFTNPNSTSMRNLVNKKINIIKLYNDFIKEFCIKYTNHID